MIFNKTVNPRKKNRVRKSTFKFAELCSMLDFIEPKPRLESQNNFWFIFNRLMEVRDREITRC